MFLQINLQEQPASKSISSQELQDILDNIHNGETYMFQEGLDKFLSIAQRFRNEDFEIKLWRGTILQYTLLIWLLSEDLSWKWYKQRFA